MKVEIATLALTLMLGAAAWAAGPAKDPTTNPDAVPHQIDRSAMKIPLQGWTPDMRYPIYPIEVRTGTSGVWYNTSERSVTTPSSTSPSCAARSVMRPKRCSRTRSTSVPTACASSGMGRT